LKRDRDAHASWVEKALRTHEAGLLAYAGRLLGDRDAARDVVQDAFLRLCEQDAAALDGHLAPWLYRVCRNRATDLLRRKKVVPRTNQDVIDEREAGTTSPPGPGAAAEGREQARAAVAALASLPGPQQEVLCLKLRHGLMYREIADVTGLTVGHVGLLVHEGMKALRRRLRGNPSPATLDGGVR
jgi:RNA polymerase sigma-70 factor (ECF subfamily)